MSFFLLASLKKLYSNIQMIYKDDFNKDGEKKKNLNNHPNISVPVFVSSSRHLELEMQMFQELVSRAEGRVVMMQWLYEDVLLTERNFRFQHPARYIASHHLLVASR